MVSGQSTTGLQGLQYNRPSASLILHSPSSYVSAATVYRLQVSKGEEIYLIMLVSSEAI